MFGTSVVSRDWTSRTGLAETLRSTAGVGLLQRSALSDRVRGEDRLTPPSATRPPPPRVLDNRHPARLVEGRRDRRVLRRRHLRRNEFSPFTPITDALGLTHFSEIDDPFTGFRAQLSRLEGAFDDGGASNTLGLMLIQSGFSGDGQLSCFAEARVDVEAIDRGAEVAPDPRTPRSRICWCESPEPAAATLLAAGVVLGARRARSVSQRHASRVAR